MIRKLIAVALAAAVVGGGSVALASTSHIFGKGGKQYSFDAVCHRVSFLPPGVSDHEALNVLGQQVHCLVRRSVKYSRVSATGSTQSVTATCPSGTSVVGGGNQAGEVAGSYPSSSRSWTVVKAHDNHAEAIRVWAVCATGR